MSQQSVLAHLSLQRAWILHFLPAAQEEVAARIAAGEYISDPEGSARVAAGWHAAEAMIRGRELPVSDFAAEQREAA